MLRSIWCYMSVSCKTINLASLHIFTLSSPPTASYAQNYLTSGMVKQNHPLWKAKLLLWKAYRTKKFPQLSPGHTVARHLASTSENLTDCSSLHPPVKEDLLLRTAMYDCSPAAQSFLDVALHGSEPGVSRVWSPTFVKFVSQNFDRNNCMCFLPNILQYIL